MRPERRRRHRPGGAESFTLRPLRSPRSFSEHGGAWLRCVRHTVALGICLIGAYSCWLGPPTRVRLVFLRRTGCSRRGASQAFLPDLTIEVDLAFTQQADLVTAK